MKQTTLLFSLIAMILLSTASCKKDEVSTRDLVKGQWEAVQFFFDDIDLIATGSFNSVTFDFEDDGDFEWRGLVVSGTNFFGSGNWTVDGDFLEIDFNSGADTFCGDNDHRFTIDFDGGDELNLEDRCNNGTNVKIELDKI